MPAGVAHQVASLPPVSSLFASVLGVNPIQHLLAPTGVLAKLPAASQATLTGREFFPSLLSGPFHSGLIVVFSVSAALSVLAGLASLLRGKRQAPDRLASRRAVTHGPFGNSKAFIPNGPCFHPRLNDPRPRVGTGLSSF